MILNLRLTPLLCIGASSLSGKTGFAGDFAYCASKFAVRGMTQAAGKLHNQNHAFAHLSVILALELAKHKITVNSYAPGPQETPLRVCKYGPKYD